MTFVRPLVAALASACLAACGGGGADAPEPTTRAAAPNSAAPLTVQLEGCVLDRHEQPTSAAVAAIGDDGRLLASSISRADGVFVMQVPAQQQLRLQVDDLGQPALELMTGRTSLSITGCLHV